MGRIVRIALVGLVVGMGGAVAALAQRGGVHGGAVGHSSGGFGGGFASSRPSFSSVPAFLGGRYGAAPALRSGVSANLGRPTPVYGRQPYGATGIYRNEGRYRQPYVSYFGPGLGYFPYYGLGFDAPYFSSDAGAGQSYAAPGSDGSGYADQNAGMPANYPTGPYDVAPAPSAPAALEDEDAVTLIFKDGRPPVQIHNYMLSRTTLYVRDGRHQEIPVDELDMVATAKVNKAAGVDFELPVVVK